MVAGHLREKKRILLRRVELHRFSRKKKDQVDFHRAYCEGKQKRAEAILMDARRNFNPEEPKVMNGDILFADYMEKWLDIIKSSVAVPDIRFILDYG